jgi:hypothetical protein
VKDNEGRQRIHFPQTKQVWYQQERAAGIPFGGHILHEKAKWTPDAIMIHNLFRIKQITL